MQKIITEKIGDQVILLLQGDVNAGDARLIRRLSHPSPGISNVHLWVDCSDLACVKLFGFCYFLNQLLVLRKMNAHITLLQVSTQHQKILQLLQMENFFSYVPNLEEAYHFVQAS